MRYGVQIELGVNATEAADIVTYGYEFHLQSLNPVEIPELVPPPRLSSDEVDSITEITPLSSVNKTVFHLLCYQIICSVHN